MIVRNVCTRQSRQLLAFNRPTRIVNRFFSTEPPVDTAVQSPLAEQVSHQESSVRSTDSPQSGIKSPAHQTFIEKQTQKNRYLGLGSQVKDAYLPEALYRSPPHPRHISLELLLANQTHLGHSTSRWNPQNSSYIFGIRDGIHIISLDATAAYLRRAAKVVEEVSYRAGLILFVGTRPGQKRAVVRAAELAGAYHVFERWIPGSLTNGQQILGHCETMVVNPFDEELPQYKETLVDRPSLKPDLVICLNPIENEVLLHECGLNNIPTIGVIDTDANPTCVTYPIPSNDDSLRATALIAGILGRAAEAGRDRRMEQAKNKNLTFPPATEGDLVPDAAKEGVDDAATTQASISQVMAPESPAAQASAAEASSTEASTATAPAAKASTEAAAAAAEAPSDKQPSDTPSQDRQ
ncbi:ribosomal protein S2 [Aspergillus campestris IBT 28561]|uniref:Ribosomal protein S2 n=1 Tax=Aspergillus campestris (strain IBT 28561) TaxID=1392248 RepID=A0A2I1D2Q6_ASPC2|nr:ribosomal protein S2 [Aspergillus campestris IBT 28561]PKY04154.1 ribosomal protein S2 [Aspergillus campestris IBT 28561]